jgi:hypothetical protein
MNVTARYRREQRLLGLHIETAGNQTKHLHENVAAVTFEVAETGHWVPH